MAAHGDDERYFYSEHLGASVAVTGSAGSPIRSVALEKGRYMLRVVDYDGASAVWVRQGNSTVVAAAAVPSTIFVPPTDAGFLNGALFTFMVRGLSPAPTAAPAAAAGGSADDFISIFQVGGTSADIQITKISRDKS